jgi:hypothetical protein
VHELTRPNLLPREDLLDELENPEVADYALDGLRHIITLRAAAILPYLIPKLTKPPITYAPSSPKDHRVRW